jgi:hypothetical protein
MKAVVLLSKTFFPQHPMAGYLTYFFEKVTGFQGNAYKKIHTCRSNYDYWKKKIDRLKAKGGVLSVRQWSEAPYRSPQETIIDIPAEIVGVQKLELRAEKIVVYNELLNDDFTEKTNEEGKKIVSVKHYNELVQIGFID